MKVLELPRELEAFLKAAEASKEDTLLFTEKKRPVAALVSLRNVDRESLALSTHSGFLKIIEASRREIREGKSISLENLEAKHQQASRRKRKRSSPRR
ncbi:MAG: hypothetical protein HY721_23525 [Planctomycetes bacterium]|nr:hypothetical protein [Planctomycetota bacterium]